MRLPSALPVVQAPMAGGPSTPALAAAVNRAGGYGFLAAGYLSADQLRLEIEATRQLTSEPFGVNLFVPSTRARRAELSHYVDELQAEARRLDVALGDPHWDDDSYAEKLDVVERTRVHLVSFTFGCPSDDVVERLHRAAVLVAATVTSREEAEVAQSAGVDVLLVQGTEAGGHQGSFLELSPNTRPLLATLEEIRDSVDVPMIGAGGVMDGRDAARVLARGAIAVAIGTALLCSPQAGTSPVYRTALLHGEYPDTLLTRAYSGRYARGLANRFALEHDRSAPQAYPEIHHLTRPLRAAATRIGDSSVPNLWAGTGWQRVTAEDAGAIVTRIGSLAS